MIKTIELDSGKEIKLSNEISWLMEYRDQFGQDIVPVLMPIILGVTQTIGALAEEVGDIEKINANAIFRLMASDNLIDIALKIASFELVDILNITWAMAKAYDPDIDEPKRWIRSLSGDNHESVPLADVIIPAVAELVVKGVMRPKNWERLTENLTTMKESLQPQKKKTTKKQSRSTL